LLAAIGGGGCSRMASQHCWLPLVVVVVVEWLASIAGCHWLLS